MNPPRSSRALARASRAAARLLALVLTALAGPVFAQSTLLQGGSTTAGHVPIYAQTGSSQPVVTDGGAAGGGGPGVGLSELNITARGTGTAPFASQGTGPLGTVNCTLDGPSTGAYHYFCLSANAQGGGLLAYGAAGGASALPFTFNVNGTSYAFPFVTGGIVGPGVSVVGHAACWNNTVGTLLSDCGAFPAVPGSNTQVLFNDSGAFAAATGLTWNKATNTLTSTNLTLTNPLPTASGGTGTTSTTGTGANVFGTSPTITTPAITNPTITTGTFTSPTITSATITSPTINGGTYTGTNDFTGATINVATQASSDSSTRAASTAMVQSAVSSIVGVQVRQTVSTGPATAGVPSFLPASAVGLSLTSQNISGASPFTVTAANGWTNAGSMVNATGAATANMTWAGLTNTATNYLYVLVAANGTLTTGSTTLVPLYQIGGSPGTTNGQFTFNIGQMQGFLGNGTTAPQSNVVFVGEAVTSGGNVTSTVAYTYNALYDSGFTATLPAKLTATSRSHNLGINPYFIDFIAECTTIDDGYAVGDQLHIASMPATDVGNTLYFPNALVATAKTMTVVAGNGAAVAWSALNKGTGASAALTIASWKWKTVAGRGW